VIDALMRSLYSVGQPLYKRVSQLQPAIRRRTSVLLGMLRYELTAGPSVSIPLDRRLWLWREGFTSRADALLDLTPESRDRFLSEYQEGLTYGINGRWKAAIDNKLSAHALLLPFAEHLPAVFGRLDAGRVQRYPDYELGRVDPSALPGGSDGAAPIDATDHVDALLDAGVPVVLKPLFGAGGKGVYVVESADRSSASGSADASGAYRVNGEPYTEAELASLVDGLEEYVIQEYVAQSAFMDELYPDAANTVRFVTMWDYEADEPFVAWSHVRIGSPRSAPLDNISQGGLQAGVDVDTGELLYAADIGDKRPPIGIDWYEDHPATDARIVGRTIPDWDELVDGVCRMAAGLPQCPYLGWDVLPTEEGFRVVEVNASPGMLNTQIAEQFMTDSRVRRFYEHHGVL
jgi:hypothetical protein